MHFAVKYVLTFLLACDVDGRGINGGVSCAACTIVTGIVGQLAQIHNETILAASMRLCEVLPSAVEEHCINVIKTLEPFLINPKFSEIFTPDVFCYGIDVCYLDRGQGYCHLFSKPVTNFRNTVQEMKKLVWTSSHMRNGLKKNEFHQHLQQLDFDVCSLPAIHELCEMFNRSWGLIQPAFDVDRDWFSVVGPARGTFWRGRDCCDWDFGSYPGRQPFNGDVTADYNCNGIWGFNPVTGTPWEDILCKDFDSRGIIYVGDSVGAHFHFPESWINPLLISKETLHNYTEPLMNELDWPHLGFATGFMNTTEPLLIKGVTDSLYLKLRSRNRCNHRDYQNLSKNGASSYDGMTYVESLARNHSTDKPILFLYGMYGNDVCNRFSDSVPHMTSAVAFHENVMNVLTTLNAVLPFGSHVILIGLVDGGFIYPTMANRIHPLGQFQGNIRYNDVYAWFNCMEMGPCSAWMNSNVTLRKMATLPIIGRILTVTSIITALRLMLVLQISFQAITTAVSCVEEYSCQRTVCCIFITLLGQPCAESHVGMETARKTPVATD
ncbi:hypothetical protein B7P43_G16153 [Cryptotermes secundus]|uniref:Saposin B-type domain-containing protein n=1 Tax=Cryptotermes secundus TaxID=105785 RepID=A0A2J7R4E0_9NEOP|nr:hypothetical protein B7P43_G16153 [Cryptotermes secundus]